MEKGQPMRLIENIALPNGLEIEIYDYSRKVAGDRWFVGFMARVPVEVKEEHFVNALKNDMQYGTQIRELFEEFYEKHGRIVYFEIKKERNFIDQRERDGLWETLFNNFKAHVLNYMKHKDFEQRFMNRRIKEFMEKRLWYR
jgi:hypothetical protein